MGLLRVGVPTVGAIPVSMMGGGAAALGAVIAYLLRATFDAANQNYADAQVLDTEAEGIQDGQLTVVEVDGTLAIVGNECAFTAQATPAYHELGMYSNAIMRSLGYSLLAVINIQAPARDFWGPALHVNAALGTDWESGGFYFGGVSTFINIRVGVSNIQVGNWGSGTAYETATVIGGYDASGVPWHSGEAAANYLYGASQYIQGGTYTSWTLLWRSAIGNTGTLYVQYQSLIAVGIIDNIRVPDADLSAVLQPLVKDTFTDANGISLDAHTPDVDDVGGGWTERTGNFDIQTNRANISVSTGARDVSTIPVGVADVFARTTIRKTVAADSGEFGHCLRYSDDNNFWMVQGDLTLDQVEIIERNGGVETQRAFNAVALTHSADYDVVAIADAQDITAFLNGGDRAAYGSAALNENVTTHGIVGNEVGQTFDTYHVHPRTAVIYDATFGAY